MSGGCSDGLLRRAPQLGGEAPAASQDRPGPGQRGRARARRREVSGREDARGGGSSERRWQRVRLVVAARASRGGRRRGLTRAGADSARVFTVGPIYMGAGKKIWTAEIHCETRSDGP
jgi:hypothetical protein